MKIKTTIEKMQGEISQTKFEGSKILKTSMEDNKRQKESAIQTKKEEIAASLSELKKELDNSSNQAKEELKNEVEMHVKSTVAKVLNIDYNDISVDGNKIDEILK